MAAPLIVGFTSFDGDEECAISNPGVRQGVTCCFRDIRTLIDGSSTSTGSSFTTADIWAFPGCRSESFALQLGVLCTSPRWTSWWVSLPGGVLGFFWKKCLKMELPDLWLFSLEVLHLIAEAGVFGDIGGDSKLAFNNCSLEKINKSKANEKY